jgi:hypothetical protein
MAFFSRFDEYRAVFGTQALAAAVREAKRAAGGEGSGGFFARRSLVEPTPTVDVDAALNESTAIALSLSAALRECKVREALRAGAVRVAFLVSEETAPSVVDAVASALHLLIPGPVTVYRVPEGPALAAGLAAAMPQLNKVSAVLDAGAGSTRLHIVRFRQDRPPVVLATGTTPVLSGFGLDDILSPLLPVEAGADDSVARSPGAAASLRANAPKHVLSTNPLTEDGVSRDDFETAAAATLAAFEEFVQKVVGDAGGVKIDDVEVAGGTARVPAVQEVATRVTGSSGVAHHVNVDQTAIAGAMAPDVMAQWIEMPDMLPADVRAERDAYVATYSSIVRRRELAAEARNTFTSFLLQSRDDLRDWRLSDPLFEVLAPSSGLVDSYLARVAELLTWLEDGEEAQEASAAEIGEMLAATQVLYADTVGPFSEVRDAETIVRAAEDAAARGAAVAAALRARVDDELSGKGLVLADAVDSTASAWVEEARATVDSVVARMRAEGRADAHEVDVLRTGTLRWTRQHDALVAATREAEAELEMLRAAKAAEQRAAEAAEAAAARAREDQERRDAAIERRNQRGLGQGSHEVTGSTSDLIILALFGLLFAAGIGLAYYYNRRRRGGGRRLGHGPAWKRKVF